MITLVLAQVLGLTEKIAAYAIKGLAVAGAFLLGYLLGGAIVWAIDKWLLANKTPILIKKLCKVLLGIVLGLIVALIVFGDSGNGLFGRGGGEGKDNHNSDSSTQKSSSDHLTQDGKAQSDSNLPKPQEIKPADSIIQITIYGGMKVIEERYYQIEDEQDLKTLKELQDAVLERKNKLKGKVAIAIRLPIDKKYISADPRVMASVIGWANKQGFDVILPTNK